MIFLPVFIYSVYKYLYNHKLRYIPLIVFTFLLMELCHLGYAGMVAIAVIIYGIDYIIQKGRKKAVLDVVISMIFGFMLLGIWLVASLRGGITSLDNSDFLNKQNLPSAQRFDLEVILTNGSQDLAIEQPYH